MYRVVLHKDISKWKKEVEIELENGIKKNEKVYKLLIKGIDMLKCDYKCGKHIAKSKQKKAIEYYTNNFEVKNLWKLDVSSNYRLMYSVEGDSVQVVSLVMELIDHKTYSKRFGYTKG